MHRQLHAKRRIAQLGEMAVLQALLWLGVVTLLAGLLAPPVQGLTPSQFTELLASRGNTSATGDIIMLLDADNATTITSTVFSPSNISARK